jgi:hypothetical protein
MEKREFDQLMKDIQKLEDRKDEINKLYCDTSMPHDDIKKMSEEI